MLRVGEGLINLFNLPKQKSGGQKSRPDGVGVQRGRGRRHTVFTQKKGKKSIVKTAIKKAPASGAN